MVTGDRKRVSQIVQNLLSNASKFTAEGRIELTVAEACIGDTVEAQFTLSDTGIGMSPDTLAKLFRPFAQVLLLSPLCNLLLTPPPPPHSSS